MSESATKIKTEHISPSEFSRAQDWLETSGACVRAQKAVLLVRQGKKSNIIGQFPLQENIDKGLTAFANRAFDEHRVVQRRVGNQNSSTPSYSLVWVAFSLRISGRPAAVAFQLRVSDSKTDDALISEIGRQVLRREEDAIASANKQVPTNNLPHIAKSSPDAPKEPDRASIPAAAPKPEKPAISQAKIQRSDDAQPAADTAKLLEEQSAVIDALATILDQRDFVQALHAFANGIARNWGCFRVSIGLIRTRRIIIKAISGVVDFDPRSALMVDIAQALEETATSASMIILPGKDKDLAPPQGHMSLAAQLKQPALCSLPLVDGEQVIGAILLERDHEFTQQEQLQLQRMALLLTPIVALKQLEAMGSLQWASRFMKRHLQALLGSSKLGLKLIIISLVAFLIWSSLYTQMFKVDAQAAIEARVQRAVVAYAPSYLSQVDKKAGDIVKQGDVLAKLDIDDLQLDRIKWVGERDKLTKEYRANLAQRDRSNIRILEARRSQAQSQIDLLDAKIERATLRAPIDGVVVSGDLSQVVGSPVEQGQLLFEVASLEEYRLSLMVDEADIGWVQIGKEGNLRLRSLPNQSFPFLITAITPVSESGEGANLFRVEASLEELPASFRPGMRGFAKIEVEPRSIGWIWSRSFVNWLRIQSWKYGF